MIILFNKIKSTLLHVVILVAVLVGVPYVYGWTAPTGAPPNDNVSAPVNVSATTQTKAGALVVATDFISNTISTNALTLPTGAGAGKVLTSDASGNASWGNSTSSIPTCATGEVVTANGTSLVCIPAPWPNDTRKIVDVIASRTVGTTYTNTNSYPIVVYVAVYDNLAGACSVLIDVGTGHGPMNYMNIPPGGGGLCGATAVVPPGATYKVPSVSGSIHYWTELK